MSYSNCLMEKCTKNLSSTHKESCFFVFFFNWQAWKIHPGICNFPVMLHIISKYPLFELKVKISWKLTITVEYISNALIYSGYKTGQFTSPYITHYADRIRINGQEKDEKSPLNFYRQLLKVRKTLKSVIYGTVTPFDNDSDATFCYRRDFEDETGWSVRCLI